MDEHEKGKNRINYIWTSTVKADESANFFNRIWCFKIFFHNTSRLFEIIKIPDE